MSLAELDLCVRVARERKTDDVEMAHLVAWLGIKAKSTTGTAKHQRYKYDSFDKFFSRDGNSKEDRKEKIFEKKREYLRMKKARSRTLKLKRKTEKEDADGINES